MKTLVSGFILGAALLGFYSCNKVKDPVIKNTTPVAVGSTFDTITNASVANFKKTLLEDYTGHKCGNCPAAAILATNLYNQYKDSIVVIAIHAGFFSKTNLDFPTSYTTTVGNDWDGSAGFAVSAKGNPNGMVNRKTYPGFTLVHKDTWATTVALAKNDPFIVKVDLKSMYDKNARALNVETKLTFLQPYTNNVKVNLVLTEDSIIGDQLDYSKNPDHIEDYEFEHMLRGSLNGSWGEVVKTAPIAATSTATLLTNNYNVNSAWKDKKLTLIAIVYDEVTKEVLQVEKVKIRK
ncbi:MAG: Omp28-related outer membrane protein [Sphingobacteriaceae bacterium]|jgi:thiol-disulfide isomerase/thioredoxin